MEEANFQSASRTDNFVFPARKKLLIAK